MSYLGEEGNNPLKEIEEKITYYQCQLEKINSKKTFPYVYIVVAIPTTILFIILTIISEGLLDFTSGITGALFFSLLITCSYLVLYQPNKDEMAKQIIRKLKKLQREKGKLEAGLRGEREVAYILRWLPKRYISMHNIVIPSDRFEPQQIDHLVIGPNGVFHLETKSINGVIIIGENGAWTMIKAVQNQLVREGMDSPRAQIQRHELVLREFFNNHFNFKISIKSLVVMAHPQTIIEGEDPTLEVVKKDRLIDYIKNYTCEKELKPKQVRQIALALARHIVDLNNK